jgi:diguanylate cyclase (GGDEF)-like protein/PAS domain S-box-containing protein
VFSRSRLTGWSVVIGIPASEVEGPIRLILLQLAAVGGALMTFALILTGLAGRSVVRRRNAYEQSLQSGKAQLAEKMQEFKTILDNSSVGITHVRDRRQIWANHCMSDMLGYSAQEMDNQSTRMFYVSQASYEELGQKGYDSLLRGERFTTEQEMRCKDGSLIWMRISGKFIVDKNPLSGSIWVFEDITERRLADQQLRIAATAFEAQEGMVVTDVDHVILRVNRAFTEITGYTAEEVVGRDIGMLKSGHHDATFYAQMWQSLREQGTWQGEIWNRRKNGEVFPEWFTITAVKDADGVVAQYVATLTDITLRKAAEDEVRQLAFYDPLTQLPNRRLLLDRLHQALVLSARTKCLGALLFIDLDNFKTLNDTLGHDVGDRLLQQVAQRLATCVRECDTVARFGGDEFVIMLEDLSDVLLEAVAQTETVGQKILVALNQPYALAAQPYHCTASIGATLFREQQNSVDDLLKRADLAMYEAKAAGRNTLRFFDPKMQADVTARATLETDLRRGLQEQEFCLYYQCQVDQAGRVTGAEALVRWQHPAHGLMFPADFIPMAEETGLILPLGNWVLEAACQQLAVWARQAEKAHLSIAVNVSAVQFRQVDFVEQVLAVIQRSGANPQKLKLELTESLLLDDVEVIIVKMIALKNWGIAFALDDFGTGYSSLTYLKRLPLDQLKIDQSFVRDLLTDPNDAAIARTIIALAQSMGLSVIAEGVETHAQRDCLAGQGCLAYQGYLFSRPLPLDKFEAFLIQGGVST